jgi:hypothetical protein
MKVISKSIINNRNPQKPEIKNRIKQYIIQKYRERSIVKRLFK